MRQVHRIATAMVVMTGRVTMLGLSRWAGTGGSSRTVQRFFSMVMPWATLFGVFFRQHLYCPGEGYLLVGDEVVAPKAGKQTYGRDRFFASLSGKPVPGLAFFALSLVSTRQRRSVPIRLEQVVRSDAEKAASQAKAAAKKPSPSSPKRPRGRPKGSKNPPKTVMTLTPELSRISGMLGALRQWIAGVVSLTSIVLDGHCGNHNALAMAQQNNLHLISRLRRDAALSWPSTGPYAGRGPRRTYGRKVDYTHIPEEYLTAPSVDGHLHTCVYQAPLLHKEFAHPLHVVMLVKTNLRPQAQAHILLCSSDLPLAAVTRVDYESLRFQSEVNFRDAKQFWGLEDFMNVTSTGVTNAANLSLFMVNVAHSLQDQGRQRDPDYSVLDVKADWRGYTYVEATIKMLPEKPEPILLHEILTKVSGFGRIHASQPSFSFS